MTKLLLLSRYGCLGASSRYRSYQYVPYLREQGFDITVLPLLDNVYLQNRYAGRRGSLIKVAYSYARRALELLKPKRYDLIWLEKEAFPWTPAWLESLLFSSGVPYVVDYDDALFHRYDQNDSSLLRWLLGKKIDRVMRDAALVIAGNRYLAKHAAEAGAQYVQILPTVVNLDCYPRASPPENRVFTIGWIGSPSTSHYLKNIRAALKEICSDGTARVVAVGAAALKLPEVPLEVRPWTEATEVKELQQFDVGIMPLPDSPWERGKCGLKLIQYMACARPIVGSPVGVNREIIDDGINGFQAERTEEWIQALQRLKNERLLRLHLGQAGRAKVEELYCLQVTAPKLARLLNKVKEDQTCVDR